MDFIKLHILETLRFETDSAQLVKALNSGSSGAELYAIVFYTLLIVNGFDFVVFVGITRERPRTL